MDTVFLEHSVRSSLVDFLERRVQCVLRDGKILIGTLLSFDQFYNLVLGHTVKRVILDKQYAEERVGLYLIRGENVATLSELVCL
jgi:small nuclear ribonucleoprotein (snRNP)-like protein